MAETQEITVRLLPDGTVQVDVQGVRGKRCLELTKPLEERLGNEVMERNFTSEYDAVQREEDLRQRGTL